MSAPAEGSLQDLVKANQGTITRDEKAAPNRRAGLAQHDTKLEDLKSEMVGIHGRSSLSKPHSTHSGTVSEPDERNRVLLLLLYASGVRRGEIAGFRWQGLPATRDGGPITGFCKRGENPPLAVPAPL